MKTSYYRLHDGLALVERSGDEESESFRLLNQKGWESDPIRAEELVGRFFSGEEPGAQEISRIQAEHLAKALGYSL